METTAVQRVTLAASLSVLALAGCTTTRTTTRDTPARTWQSAHHAA